MIEILVHTTLDEQIFHIPKAQIQSVIEPDRVADDLGRKAMPDVAGLADTHPAIVAGAELT